MRRALALALDGVRKAGQRLEVGDRIVFGEAARPRLRCSARWRRPWPEGRGRRGDAGVRSGRRRSRPRHRRQRGRCRCRPTSPAAAPRTSATCSDYQTIYAREDGSVAAPTAGLHFTPELMAALDARGVSRHFVTLHVGAGTFLPVKTEDVAEHRMHAETGEVSAPTADAAERGPRRGAGGSSRSAPPALRLLESAADEAGAIQPFAGETSIFITPGYRFRTAARPGDQLPPAALDAVHAGQRLRGLDDDAGGLCPRDRGRLSVLFLRRRQPAVAGRMSALAFRIDATRRRRAHRRNRHAARRDPHAGLHAGRHLRRR